MTEREAVAEYQRSMKLLKRFRDRGADFRLTCCNFWITGSREKVTDDLVGEIMVRKRDVFRALILEAGGEKNPSGFFCKALNQQQADTENLLFCECNNRFVGRAEAESWTLGQQKPDVRQGI